MILAQFTNRRRFADLDEREILALAISSEEDDARIYRTYADRLRESYPRSAEIFEAIAPQQQQGGAFSAEVTLDYEGRTGLYHVRVWVMVAGIEGMVPAVDAIIRVGER